MVRDALEMGPGRHRRLVVLLTSPGGYMEVASRIVDTIRHIYPREQGCTVAFLIPNQTYSAGTALALSGTSLWMDYYSRLGPIAPQVKNNNGNWVHGLGYLEKYEEILQNARAGDEIQRELLAAFDQAELHAHQHAIWLVTDLLRRWLKDSPLLSDGTAPDDVIDALSDTSRWHSHGYGISRDVLRNEMRLEVNDFSEEDPDVEDSCYNFSEEIREHEKVCTQFIEQVGSPAGLVHRKGLDHTNRVGIAGGGHGCERVQTGSRVPAQTHAGRAGGRCRCCWRSGTNIRTPKCLVPSRTPSTAGRCSGHAERTGGPDRPGRRIDRTA